MASGASSSALARSSEGARLSVQLDPARGRCLVAESAIPAGACLLRADAIGSAVLERHRDRCCHSCLSHCPEGESLGRRCGGCGAAAFCSPACAAAHGPEECAMLLGLAAQAGSLKHEVLFEARWLASTVFRVALKKHEAPGGLLLGVEGGPGWRWVTALAPDCRDITGFHKRSKRRKTAARAFSSAAQSLAGQQQQQQQQEEHCREEQERGVPEPLPGLPDLEAILGAAPLNDFGIYSSEGALLGRANFPLAALANHSCVPNAAARQEGPQMCLYALRAIEAGEEICHCYVNLDEPEAQSLIRQTWGFVCACRRCRGGEVSEFDASYRCECGGVVLPSWRGNGGECRCNESNLL